MHHALRGVTKEHAWKVFLFRMHGVGLFMPVSAASWRQMSVSRNAGRTDGSGGYLKRMVSICGVRLCSPDTV